jgi:hypothetical protein
MRRSKAGAMEALTVIVLAVAAIVLAAVVWVFLLGSTQMQTAAPDFVFDASLISTNPGSCRLSITVKNTGSVPLEQFNVYIGGTSVSIPPIASPSNPLPPGRSASSAGNVACSSPGSNVVIELEALSGQNRIRKVARAVVQ